MKKLKLGTRRSLLAQAQSATVARMLESKHSDLSVELVGIETQGDRVQDLPLSKMEGKEFFVAELDRALISSEVDLTVHSFKDLSLDRPSEIALGAIPERANPRDVILFHPRIFKKISSGEKVLIGTSSPRRIETIPPFLKDALPKIDGKQPLTEMVEIRGNVDTRLRRALEERPGKPMLDGVVLALAGLARLWADESSREKIAPLIAELRWIVLPLGVCPTAPAQGALAIECRSNDDETRSLLAAIHSSEAQSSVEVERKVLQEFGGGCHQKFGATAVQIRDFELLMIAGKKQTGEIANEWRWNRPAPIAGEAFDGMKFRPQFEMLDEPTLGDANFVANSRSLSRFEKATEETRSKARIYASGVPSWMKLASRGFFVEGCADGLGFDFVRSTLDEPVLGLPKLDDWHIFSHEAALDTWPAGKTFPTHRIEYRLDANSIESAKKAKIFYWASGSQFLAYREHLPADSTHCCGLGKTADLLEKEGVSYLGFPGYEQWKRWVAKNE